MYCCIQSTYKCPGGNIATLSDMGKSTRTKLQLNTITRTRCIMLIVYSTSLMTSLIRSVGGLSTCFCQGLWLADLNADVVGKSINRRGVCLGIPTSRDCFFFLFCTISVWISIQIPEGMDGPVKHETSARCRASRSVKQSIMLRPVPDITCVYVYKHFSVNTQV